MQALRGIGHLFVDTGLTRERITRLGVDAFAAMAEPTASLVPDVLECLGYALHALTRWHSGPDRVDADGRPRPLPLRGKVSVTSLARATHAQVDACILLRVLACCCAVRRVRAGWLPTARALLVTSRRGYRRARGLLLVCGVLRNTADKAAVLGTGRVQGRFERMSASAHIPVVQRSLVYRRVEALGAQFLAYVDLDMRRRGKPELLAGERARVSVGVYLFECGEFAGDSAGEGGTSDAVTQDEDDADLAAARLFRSRRLQQHRLRGARGCRAGGRSLGRAPAVRCACVHVVQRGDRPRHMPLDRMSRRGGCLCRLPARLQMIASAAICGGYPRLQFLDEALALHGRDQLKAPSEFDAYALQGQRRR